jgi:hypothetical protein
LFSSEVSGVTQAQPRLLEQVTLCCVDTTARLPWAIRAIGLCLQHVRFAEVLLFTDRPLPADLPCPPEVRVLPLAPLGSVEAYSHFMLKELAVWVRSSHVLVVQWDGYILNPAAWRDEFLAYDYLGAPWTHEAEPFKVGNGGFSLRSRRLLQALLDPAFPTGHPEDLLIGKTWRPALEQRGLRFAPTDLAAAFSIEDGSLAGRPFGFHAPYHFPEVLTGQELSEFVASLEASALRSWWMGNFLREMARARREGRLDTDLWWLWNDWLRTALEAHAGPACAQPAAVSWCKSLLRYGYLDQATQLLTQRREAGVAAAADRKLVWRCAALRVLAPVRGWVRGRARRTPGAPA